MSAILLDGKKSSTIWLEESKSEISSLGITPTLALIRVGDDPASAIYLEKKRKACKSVGINSLTFEFDKNSTQDIISKKIDELNKDKNVHAILVQVPIPSHLDVLKLQEKINPLKDVDGFGPYNMGRLFMGDPLIIAATPAGVMRLLSDYKLDVASKNCIVIGRSNIVGKPLSMLLLNKDATVQIAHSKTKNLAQICKLADFIFGAVGKCSLIKKGMVKSGAVVIDIGMNRPQDGPVCGDVDFDQIKKIASYITPVPGGVGPMTVASLIANTLIAYKLQKGD